MRACWRRPKRSKLRSGLAWRDKVAEDRCLSFAGQSSRFQRDGQACTIEPAGALCSNRSQVLIHAAAIDLGVIHIPAYHMAEACRTHELVPVFGEWRTTDSVVFNIVYARNRFMPSRVRLLIDYLLSCSFLKEDKGLAVPPLPPYQALPQKSMQEPSSG